MPTLASYNKVVRGCACDHQETELPLERLRKGVKGLAKLAKIFQMPIVVSGVAREDGGPATMITEIEEGYGPYPIHHRTTANSLLNDDIAALIRNSGKRTILISGVATELAVQLPAVSAPEMGYRAIVVLDACGGVSERTEQAAINRMTQAGSITTSVMTLAGDFPGLTGTIRRDYRSGVSGIRGLHA